MKPRTLSSAGSRSPEVGGSPSLMRAAWELAFHRMTRTEKVAANGMRPRASLRASGLRISRRRLGRYLRATRGYTQRGGVAAQLLPPTVASLWEAVYLLDLIRIADLPFPAGIIHLGSERILVRPLETHDEARLDLAILKAWSWRGGTRLQVGSTTCNSAGHLCAEGEVHLLLHGVELDLPEYVRGAEGGRDERPVDRWTELARWRMGAGTGRRYASVSGDINPIHLSPLTARWFGFSRAVAHGACIEAMIAHELISGRAGGDVAALRRLLIRFTSPLLLPADVVLQVHDRAGDTGANFQLIAAERPETVYAAGEWV